MRAWPLLWLVACGTAPDAAVVTVTPTRPAELATTAQHGRSWRRMDIDQLDASLQAVTGVPWTEVAGRDTIALFDKLSGSLGKPDYQSSTDEDLTAGLLFQKFLDDAASMTCAEGVRQDPSRDASDRRILVHVDLLDRPGAADEDIDRNVASALQLFHGLSASPEQVAVWRGLFDSVLAATDDTGQAWTAVCVALITHPTFTAY